MAQAGSALGAERSVVGAMAGMVMSTEALKKMLKDLLASDMLRVCPELF